MNLIHCMRTKLIHEVYMSLIENVCRFVVELYARVSRTTSILLSRVFDAHHHHAYTGYEYSA